MDEMEADFEVEAAAAKAAKKAAKAAAKDEAAAAAAKPKPKEKEKPANNKDKEVRAAAKAAAAAKADAAVSIPLVALALPTANLPLAPSPPARPRWPQPLSSFKDEWALPGAPTAYDNNFGAYIACANPWGDGPRPTYWLGAPVLARADADPPTRDGFSLTTQWPLFPGTKDNGAADVGEYAKVPLTHSTDADTLRAYDVLKAWAGRVVHARRAKINADWDESAHASAVLIGNGVPETTASIDFNQTMAKGANMARRAWVPPGTGGPPKYNGGVKIDGWAHRAVITGWREPKAAAAAAAAAPPPPGANPTKRYVSSAFYRAFPWDRATNSFVGVPDGTTFFYLLRGFKNGVPLTVDRVPVLRDGVPALDDAGAPMYESFTPASVPVGSSVRVIVYAPKIDIREPKTNASWNPILTAHSVIFAPPVLSSAGVATAAGVAVADADEVDSYYAGMYASAAAAGAIVSLKRGAGALPPPAPPPAKRAVGAAAAVALESYKDWTADDDAADELKELTDIVARVERAVAADAEASGAALPLPPAAPAAASAHSVVELSSGSGSD